MAWSGCARWGFVGIVAALTACGTGVTFGVAPGPAEPGPVVDSGPLVPPRDAGPPPQPPPDAGCEEVELPPLTDVESEQIFVAEGLPAEFACAACHRGKSPLGAGINWGPTSSAPTDADWHQAALALADRAEAEHGPSPVIADTTLYRAFNNLSAAHPVDAAGQAAMEAWLGALWEPRYELVCAPKGDCEPTSRPVTDAESQADFEARGLPGHLSCATCHRGAAKSPSGLGFGWGVTDNTPAAWHAAVQGLMAREAPGASVDETSLYLHFNGSDATHPVNEPARTAASGWVVFTRTSVEVPPPGDCTPADAGPDPACTPLPATPAESQAEFEAQGLPAQFGCASCHRGATRSGAGSGIDWGVAQDTPEAWHASCSALAERQTGAAVESTTLYTHFNGSDSVHPVNGPARDAMEAWLTFIRTPPPPPGCP